MLIKTILSELSYDSVLNVPVMLLKEKDGNRQLPIWIGVAEASSIALQKTSQKSKRPLTHDLIKSLFDTLNIVLENVCIDAFKDDIKKLNLGKYSAMPLILMIGKYSRLK